MSGGMPERQTSLTVARTGRRAEKNEPGMPRRPPKSEGGSPVWERGYPVFVCARGRQRGGACAFEALTTGLVFCRVFETGWTFGFAREAVE